MTGAVVRSPEHRAFALEGPTHYRPQWVGEGDPNEKLVVLTQFLDDMEQVLVSGVTNAGAHVNIGEPYQLLHSPQLEGSTDITLFDESGVLAGGFAHVVAEPLTGGVNFVLELTEGEITRTLEQELSLEDGVLTSWGVLIVAEGPSSTPLPGGWQYDELGGVMIDPDSDPAFASELAAMLHVPETPGRGFSLGGIFSFIGNVVGMVINYVIDIFIPYTPPVVCSGPSIYNGGGQSCEGANIACEDKLSQACGMINDLPGVSTGFRQCMKGRCGCGGSSFGRARMGCANSTDCGPCVPPPGVSYGGCSLAGAEIWYCDDTPICPNCIQSIFHELSHGCGAQDGFPEPTTGESYRIGEWFSQEFDERFPDACAPVQLTE